MQKKYACVRYLHTRITVYHPCKIDLRYSKALHSCVTCRLLQLGLPCSAIHYGMCQAVTLPPTGSKPSPGKAAIKTRSAQKPKPVSVPIPKPVPARVRQPIPAHPPIRIPVQTRRQVSAQTPQTVPAQTPKPVPIPNSTPTVSILAKTPAQTPGQFPVVAVTRRSAVPNAVVVNDHNVIVPMAGPKSAQPSAGPQILRPADHSAEPAPMVPKADPVHSAGAVTRSVPPETPVVVRTGPGNSATVPGGGIVVKAGHNNGVGVGVPKPSTPSFPPHTGAAGIQNNYPNAGFPSEGSCLPILGISGGVVNARTTANTTNITTTSSSIATSKADDRERVADPFKDGKTSREGNHKRGIAVVRPCPQGDTTTTASSSSSAGSNSGQDVPRKVVTRTPVRLATSKPTPLTLSAVGVPRPFSIGGEEDEMDSCPAFPVSPEDRIQVAASDGHSPECQRDGRQPQEADDRHVSTERTPPSNDHFPTTTATTTTNGAITGIPTVTATSNSSFLPSPSSSSSPSSLSSPSVSSSKVLSSSSSSTSLSEKVDSYQLRTPDSVVLGAVSLPPKEEIPQFYFPMGKPPAQCPGELEVMAEKLGVEFESLQDGKAGKEHMAQIAKACGLPVYWKMLLYRAAGGEERGHVTLNTLTAMLHRLYSSCHDEASRFVSLVAQPGRLVLHFHDLVPLVQDVVDGHPGLSFLQDAPEFHSRYIHTVVSRIFFCANRSWSGKLTIKELRRSNFLRVLAMLEEEEDINRVTDYFSYEHFYVIYCKFWELDRDHDLYIDKDDLARHNDQALNSRIIDRIFSGAVSRGKDLQEGRMPYKEFVWFLMAEEDKKHPTSIEYWFRCMDIDGDGVISMYEMEFFYEEQMQKMEALGIEKLPFEDCLCQMFDLVRPRHDDRITLSDLKKCRMADIFYDTFFNLDKFLEHEQRDPFATIRELDASGQEISDWDRYAAEEYDILVAEEGINEQEEILFDEDFYPEEDTDGDEGIQQLVTPRLHPATSEDIFDVTNSTMTT